MIQNLLHGSLSKASNKSTNKTDTAPRTNSVTSTTTNSTQGLEKGQQLRGEIIDLQNKEVTFQLSDGRIYNGKIEDMSNLSIGSTVTFQVEDVSLRSLSLKLIENSAPFLQDATIDKALIAAGLPKNSRNIAIINELLKNNMSIDKKSLLQLIQQSIVHKNTSIETLVFFTKHQIPITDANLNQYSNYSNLEHNIVTEMTALAEELPVLLSQVSEGIQDSDSKVQKLLQLLVIDNPTEQQNKMPETPPSLKTGGLPNTPDVVPSTLEDITSTLELSTISETNESSEVITMEQELDPSPTLQSILSAEERNSLANQFDPTVLSKVILEQIKTGEITTKELFKQIKTLFLEHPDSVSREIWQSKELKELVKNELLSKWTISPKELEQTSSSLSNKYTSILEHMDHIKEFLQQNPSTLSESLSTKMQNMSDNIHFMNNINQMFQYVQIPFRQKDQVNQSELYVYSRKGSKSIEEGVNVLLHLDMEQLGPMDIFLELKNHSVHSKFCLDTDSTIEFISLHIEILEKALERKGYQLQSEFIKREREIVPTEEFIKTESFTTELSRFNFDLRA